VSRYRLHPTMQDDFGEDDQLAITWCVATAKCNACQGYIDVGAYMVWERADISDLYDEAEGRVATVNRAIRAYPSDKDHHVYLPHCIACALDIQWIEEGP
jgi:hypothetical protein